MSSYQLLLIAIVVSRFFPVVSYSDSVKGWGFGEFSKREVRQKANRWMQASCHIFFGSIVYIANLYLFNMIAEICLSILLLTVSTQGRLLQGGQVILNNSEYSVQVNGNVNNIVPFYTFYHQSAPEDVYRMQLQKMVEIENGNNVGGSNIALPSLDWTVELIEGETFAFWLNATGGVNDPFDVMAFRNELLDRTIKYDFILEGYEFVSDTADFLTLEWKLSNATGPSGSPYLAEEDQICYFGGQGTEADAVCVDITSTATATNNSVAPPVVSSVDVTLAEDGGFVVVSYAKFVGDLFHDPEFGTKNKKLKCFLNKC
jgi:hypothetical protein